MADETTTSVSSKYANFEEVFPKDLAIKWPEHNRIKIYAIDLIKSYSLPYDLVCSLDPVILGTLKTYIKINLIKKFILAFKFLTGILIFFVKKLDQSLQLYVNYRDINNLTIKNCYPLSLIGKSLDWLGCPKGFTQLDVTSPYYCMWIWEEDK